MWRLAATSRTAALGLGMVTAMSLAPNAAEARVRPHYGGEVRIETSEAEPPEFVKLLAADTLTHVDARGEVKPGLAVRWENQNGFRRWQFWLRPGVRMHGQETDVPMTAAMVANVLRAGLAKNGMEGRVQNNGEWVAVEFGSAVPQFAALLAGAEFGVISGASDERSLWEGHAATSGAYTIQSGSNGRVALEANPEYWGGQRFPETITVTCGRSAHEQSMDLAARRADLVEVSTEELRRAQQERARLSQVQAVEVIVLEAERARGADVKLRQALSEAIDRAALLNFIFQKQGEATGGLLPSWISGYGALMTAAHDTAHARQLQMEAGGRGSFTLGYEAGDAELQLVAERIVLNAREAGMTAQAVARTNNVDWVLRRVVVRSANPAAALTGIVHALQELKPLELNDTTLESVYRAERAVLANYTVIPLLHLNKAWAASERMRDWAGAAFGTASPGASAGASQTSGFGATAIAPLPVESWVESRP